ncbi:hypothetical protein GCM10010149_38520 [Nonomuraea roseoviolacea subsp. roseoviolacea]
MDTPASSAIRAIVTRLFADMGPQCTESFGGAPLPLLLLTRNSPFTYAPVSEIIGGSDETFGLRREPLWEDAVSC